MLVRSARPLDLEMPISGFADYITPVDRFFVRSHVYTPRVDIAQWRLTIDGQVGNPMTLTMEDLRRILASREALYARADAVVDTAARSVKQSLKDLERAVP